MKRLLASLGIAAALLAPSFASAQRQDVWKLVKFRADMEIRPDGSLEVTETIDADFTSERHGIFRYLPTTGKDMAGKAYSTPIKLRGVTRDGKPERADSSMSGGDLVWRIGEPDSTLSGQHEYVLNYSVIDAIRHFDDHDELYWNVSGDGWDVPLPNVSATVMTPDGVVEPLAACYTGAYGSTESDCQIITAGAQVGFVTKTAGEPLTVVVGFPKGILKGPSLWDRFIRFLAAWGIWILPIGVFVFCYLRWRKDGRDASLGALVAQYDAPAGLTPAETAALLSQNAMPNMLAPSIVDLAARGYLKIEETDKKGLLGTSKSYALIKAKDWKDDPALRPFETKLLGDLLGTSDRVELSSLKNTFYPHVGEFTTGVMRSLTERGYFAADPQKVRGVWMGVGIGIVILDFFIGSFAAATVGPSGPFAVAACGVIVAVFGYFMPKRSPEGVAAAAHAQGYKEFISSVEKYRAPWMEDQNIFFKTLPYALAFGLGAKWAQAFSGLQMQPPSWYVGTNMATWSALSFNDDLSSWSKSMAAMAASRPSSGSGLGGGGFSGGGFGGGGGGSW